MARVAAECEEMISGYDKTLRGLEEAVRQVTDEHDRVHQRLSEVRSTLLPRCGNY
jgi:hypothetical protein